MSLHEHDLGLTWTAGDTMDRAAHALAHDGRVWLVDPFEDAGALERAAALGEPAAVVQLLGRHNRDGEAIARRLGVPRLVMPEAIPGSPLQPRPILRRLPWPEMVLWWPERQALVVPEALGTAPTFAVGDGPVGVHPLLRFTPPRALRSHAAAQHLLVGHGPPRHGPGTGAEIAGALDHARRDIPRLLAALPGIARRGRSSR